MGLALNVLRLGKLDTTWEEFQVIQSNIEELDSKHDDDERISFEDEYYRLAALAVNLIEQHDRRADQSKNANVNLSNQSSQYLPSNNGIKLQSISLPHFSGSYEGWLQFFEIFQALVDKNPDLSKIQKFYYLQSCLRGEAVQVLQSLEICEANYEVAIDLLRERYENKRVLIHNHVRNLFEIQAVTKESHQSLRKLIDQLVRNLRALTSLNQPVEQWDTLLLYLVTQKLDSHTRKEWEVFNKKASPTFEEFLNFLKNKCQVLETVDNKHQLAEKHAQNRVALYVNTTDSLNMSSNSNFNQSRTANNVACNFCGQNTHLTYKCQKLLALSCKDRYNELRRLNICTNCLRPGHASGNCNGKNCRVCNKRHNSILHEFTVNNRNSNSNNVQNIHNSNSTCSVSVLENQQRNNHGIRRTDQAGNTGQTDCNGDESSLQASSTAASDPRSTTLNACSNEATATAALHSFENQTHSQVLLATAMVYVLDGNNKPIKCRALLDSASQSNFCSAEFHQRLNLPINKINVPVLGINNAKINIASKFKTTVKSLNGTFQSNIEFLVIEKVTTRLPQVSFDPCLLKLPQNLKLADPEFSCSQNIDILIGTELFFHCLEGEKLALRTRMPTLQNTKFGWIIAGPLYAEANKMCQNNVQCFLTINNSQDTILHNLVQQFWQIESYVDNKQNKLTNEELECEIDFRKNVQNDLKGRFIVKLPVKEKVCELGESYSIALKCLLSLERRLGKNPELRQQYTEFLNEYEKLGHMSRVDPKSDQQNETCVYLSHHAVVKASSSTTKVRVVFNASLKTSSGLSLNDVLKAGPKVQRDVFDIVLQMRSFPILIVADIEKMYRMILIHESQRKLQRILWRDNSGEIIHFQLNTVTYGTVSASFLATRVLHEIGKNYNESNPEASKIISNNFYMDDLIFGHHDLDKAVELKDQIDEILLKHGFKLRKWMSNEPRTIQDCNDTTSQDGQFYIRGEVETKTLGTVWNPKFDTIGYNFQLNIQKAIITKRSILAGIGQLFDILGLISPVIVKAKLICQEIWKIQLDWDTPVPKSIADEWLDFVSKLSHLRDLQIPRCVLIPKCNQNSVTLCGFCDASQVAYGACVYLISHDANGKIESYLICAKSRLAPLKSMSLPRLELCGALLLAQLIDRVIKALEIQIKKINLFTDSTIVLDWLSSEPSKWKIFIANRVAEIQRLTENMTWCHVNTDVNPADIVSRGSDPLSLQNHSLWWHGPSFLTKDSDLWPDTQKIKINIPEARKENLSISFPVLNQNVTSENEIFSEWSSYTKLIRVLCYIYRFYNNIHATEKVSGPITNQELNNVLIKICKIVQAERFSQEIRSLKSDKAISNSSNIASLNPFIDEMGVLRVGGRLTNSLLKFERKHPIILPSRHKFVKLLTNYYHQKYLHAGPQFVLTQLRDKFWIVNGRNEVRKVLKGCITCFRVKPGNISQMMGSLPSPRVVPSRTFFYCGIDYAGPYYLKDGKTRTRIIIKAYICIFVCLSTRAVHAELVTDLSSEAFLNAFKRFVSRRGLSGHIFSDNATNFIGAKNELQKLFHVVRESVNNKYQKYFAEHNIKWHFIPARSPHHGGIWESAVRSFKYHLKRILGDSHLNFENFYTLLTQIEAILNSRPILPLTNDPSDMEVLTPGHFLIGESLVALPQSNEINIPTNRLKHYKQLQQLVQRFWSIWSKDYLNSLQQRSKWRSRQENIKVDTLVLLKEDHVPPMHWLRGRIVSVHPGKDKLVRVVSVRTKSGVVQRSITKICPLPEVDSME